MAALARRAGHRRTVIHSLYCILNAGEMRENRLILLYQHYVMEKGNTEDFKPCGIESRM
jgi:hypothetical protein